MQDGFSKGQTVGESHGERHLKLVSKVKVRLGLAKGT